MPAHTTSRRPGHPGRGGRPLRPAYAPSEERCSDSPIEIAAAPRPIDGAAAQVRARLELLDAARARRAELVAAHGRPGRAAPTQAVQVDAAVPGK